MRYLVIILLALSFPVKGQFFFFASDTTGKENVPAEPPAPATCASDTILTTEWSRNDAANVILSDGNALNSDYIDAMNGTASRFIKGYLANDMDSLYIVISSSSAGPITLRVTTSTDSVEFDHDGVTGSYSNFVGRWCPITGSAGDSVKIRVTNLFCHFDYAVNQLGAYPCVSGGVDYTYSVAENLDIETFVGVLGDSVENGNAIPMYEDWEYLFTRNDSLFLLHSLDYEDPNTNRSIIAGFYDELDSDTLVVTINITDVTDNNGYISQLEAHGLGFDTTKFRHYMIYNANSSGDQSINITLGATDTLTIFHIHARTYSTIIFNHGLAKHDSASGNRNIYTNWQGQVRLTSETLGIGLRGEAEGFMLSGKYRPGLTGSEYYKGFDDATRTEFLSGTFGIYIDAKWPRRYDWSTSIYGNGIEVDGGVHQRGKWEYIEFNGSIFSALNNKTDDKFGVTYQDSVMYCYLHDIEAETNYFGNKNDPGINPGTPGKEQTVFSHGYIANNWAVRAGCEALQFNWIRLFIIENNVSWGALDFLSSFQNFQAGAGQFAVAGDTCIIRDNIFIATGAGFNMDQRQPNDSTEAINLPFTGGGYNRFHNNVVVNPSKNQFFYFASDSASTGWKIYDNYFGGLRVSNVTYGWGQFEVTYETTPYLLENDYNVWVSGIDLGIEAYNNTIDSTIPNGNITSTNSSGSAADTSLGNTWVDTIPALNFVNVYGDTTSRRYDWWLTRRFARTIGEDAQPTSYTSADFRRDSATRWTAGMVAQTYENYSGWNTSTNSVLAPQQTGETRFYRCILTYEDASVLPTNTTYWQLMSWQTVHHITGDTITSYYPPDNFTLPAGHVYRTAGIGYNR